MNLTSVQVIKTLLSRHGITPTKRLGQNFLISRLVLQKFIEAADISKNDTVLEVGSGMGTITVELAKHAKKVLAVEKDPRLVATLKTVCTQQKNIHIVQGDIREISNKELGIRNQGYKLVGNLPFYLTNFLIRKFLESDVPPKDMTLVVQKEVAERICAQPPRMNLLAVSVQFYGIPKLISRVPKSSFWPQPEVDAAILRISTPAGTVPASGDCPSSVFFKTIKAGFSHPRKLLASNLAKKLGVPKEKIEATLTQNHISPRARAENLSIEDWKNVSRMLEI